MKTIYLSRSIRQIMRRIQEKLIFIFSHLSWGSKLALFALALCFVSLFIPWFSIQSETLSTTPLATNAFSRILWYIWFLYFFLICINIFYIISIKKKSELRNISGISFSSTRVTQWMSIFMIFSSIHMYFIIQGMLYFSSQISHEKGLILFITGAMLVWFSWYFLRKEEKKHISGSYSHAYNSKEIPENPTDTAKNMKLPI